MKQFAEVMLGVGLLGGVPPAIAAEWESVTQNVVGDRFLIDQSSIQRKADAVFYWEYREFPQPNNAFLEESVDKPVHGVVLNWSANCTSKTQRLRQITAYDKERKVIKRFSYGENGALFQPRAGSSASTVLNYVCDR
ncbi:hypothetical protein OsccyDRAFT_0999 [Leptolyngbyaceae cyanobacterium JSC-12]|nr:hypothetical protein OsccyDRAFT_0999 [Leptolyngbyaceae cyanobacterium JSC-12]